MTDNPAAFPKHWTMRETAHFNGGKEWFGYEYQCNQEPRLRRMDRYKRADRSVASTFRVDGEDCASVADALERLARFPVIGSDEEAVLFALPDGEASKADLSDLDWRNRRDSLSQKGLIWWQAGKVRRTALADAMLLARQSGENRRDA